MEGAGHFVRGSGSEHDFTDHTSDAGDSGSAGDLDQDLSRIDDSDDDAGVAEIVLDALVGEGGAAALGRDAAAAGLDPEDARRRTFWELVAAAPLHAVAAAFRPDEGAEYYDYDPNAVAALPPDDPMMHDLGMVLHDV